MKDNKSPSGVVRGPEGGVTMCDKRAINYSDVMTIINSGRCYIANDAHDDYILTAS